MRLSLVDDYDDADGNSVAQSQDSVSLDIAAAKDTHSASYTNLFDPSQTSVPVGASYQQTRGGSTSPRNIPPRDLRYDRSPRPKVVAHPSNRPTQPPLATPEDFSPVDSSKPPLGRPNINSPGAERYNYGINKPRSGSSRPQNEYRGHSRPHKVNGYPVRSSSEERFRDGEKRPYNTNNSTSGNYRQVDERLRRSQDYLDQRPRGQPLQGSSQTLPNQSRHANNFATNQNRHANEGADDSENADVRRPMSFVKALEMSEIMQTRDKDIKERQRREEKKKSVYDSAYEIAV